jgi:glucose-6-phosphate 1-dehydrogenase
MNKISVNVAAPAGPCCFAIFGASGDLTHRLLVPALYNLAAGGLLPDAFAIIGIARSEMSNDAFRSDLAQALRRFALRKVDEETADRLLACATYVNGDANDPSTYERLDRELARVERACATGGNRLFYLATPPAAFAPISGQLGRSGIAREENGTWRRLIIEKPFGTDLASAQTLNRELLELLEEHQIYRIDHYLGKETVQNILVLRFANGLFEPIWNRDHIDHVQITVAETLPVGRRGRFYDATGALRDMVPNSPQPHGGRSHGLGRARNRRLDRRAAEPPAQGRRVMSAFLPNLVEIDDYHIDGRSGHSQGSQRRRRRLASRPGGKARRAARHADGDQPLGIASPSSLKLLPPRLT